MFLLWAAAVVVVLLVLTNYDQRRNEDICAQQGHIWDEDEEGYLTCRRCGTVF